LHCLCPEPGARRLAPLERGAGTKGPRP
jgi:hypothetical protein